ncbi:MAG: hypothetical protein WBE90_10975 [Xanthobacteraceae bacterium]
MPNDPSANIVMICTGTGSAPFRGFIERRRRAMPQASGSLVLFFVARKNCRISVRYRSYRQAS